MVTVAAEHGSVGTSDPPTGVCLIRVEPTSIGLLLTVTTTSDIERRTPEQVQRFTTVGSAIRVVLEFLEAWEGNRGDGSVTEPSLWLPR